MAQTATILRCFSAKRTFCQLQQRYRTFVMFSKKKGGLERHFQCHNHVKNAITSSQGQANSSETTQTFVSPIPQFDWDYLCNDNNAESIQTNIKNRKGVGDIYKVQSLYQKLQQQRKTDPVQAASTEQELLGAAADIPNISHPGAPVGDESCAREVQRIGKETDFMFTPKSVVELGQTLGVLRTENVGYTSGPRSYYFFGALAQLESALVNYTVDRLLKQGFTLISVPNIIHPSVIEGCGFKTSGERTQVYKLEPDKYGHACLAGTGEMPLAGYFMNKVLSQNDMPQKVMTLSQCYRAETSDVEEERGIYRVHQFSKVEMFGLTVNETGTESDQLMQELISIQQQLFADMGLYVRVLDMPTQELGAPAYRKYDMETWMPAKCFWGEISSTSNCTDFQSRRLNIQYERESGETKHAHTVNGTACAVPRMIMAIMENYQLKDGSVTIPTVLQPYMNGETIIQKSSHLNDRQWIKLTKTYKNKAKSKIERS